MLPMENAAALLGDLLHASQGMWSPADLASAMQTAAKAGHVGMMKQLSAHGVAYDVRTANGFLPIHQACAGARAEAIDFLGAQPRIEDLYRGSHLFLLLSEYESFGLVALEAAACAVPVVPCR